MATKLRSPISLQIEDAETAVWLCNALHWLSKVRPVVKESARNERIDECVIESSLDLVRCALQDGLEGHGIDRRYFPDPPPFRIANYETEFLPDGSVKVGCTTVSAAEMDEVIKRRAEVVKKETVQEWPKYWLDEHGSTAYRAMGPDDNGMTFDTVRGEWQTTDRTRMVDFAARRNLKPITSAEAAAIVGGKNL